MIWGGFPAGLAWLGRDRRLGDRGRCLVRGVRVRVCGKLYIWSVGIN